MKEYILKLIAEQVKAVSEQTEESQSNQDDVPSVDVSANEAPPETASPVKPEGPDNQKSDKNDSFDSNPDGSDIATDENSTPSQESQSVIGGGTNLNITGGGGSFGSSSGGSSALGDLNSEDVPSVDSDSSSDGLGKDQVGQIPVDYDNPTEAVYDEAERLAGVTQDIPRLTAAIKASIQVNFSNYDDANELLNKLKMSNNPILNAVAQRLTLFMERNSLSNRKGKKRVMKISEKELRKMVKEAVRAKMLKEGSYFEQAKLKQEMDSLALDFLEKVSTKLGINPTDLPPEAEMVFNKVHEELRSAVKTAAAQMLQLGTVVKAAEEV